MLNARFCPNCGDLVAGRANKVFCSATCKGQHFRANAEPEARLVIRPVMVSTALVAARPVALDKAPLVEPDVEDEEEDFLGAIPLLVDEAFARKDEARAQELRAARNALHEQYAEVVVQFLKFHKRYFELVNSSEVDKLERFLDRVKDVEKAYFRHPEAYQDNSAPAARLELLADMLLELRDLVQEGRALAGRSFLWTPRPKPRCVVWEKGFRTELTNSLKPPH